jgi:Sec-independent protein translocase protein TatA
MLDNLGLGEFFFLALLALLFFGPERLPSIGARLGQWVRSLTQYSSAFLNEWREEALAVHEAVEQVRGIRDEIVAAQAEITGTLEMARSDASDAVSGARHDVRQQIQRSTQVLPDDTAPPAAAASAAQAGEDAAIAKTGEILDALVAKRGPAQDGPEASQQAGDSLAKDTPLAPGTPTQTTPQRTHPRSITPVHPTDIAQLRDQVAALQREMDDLHKEVALFRARTQSSTRSERATSIGEQEATATERPPEASPQAVPVGEPA